MEYFWWCLFYKFGIYNKLKPVVKKSIPKLKLKLKLTLKFVIFEIKSNCNQVAKRLRGFLHFLTLSELLQGAVVARYPLVRQMRYKNSGFTILELVTVVAILAIISTAALLSMDGVSADAKYQLTQTEMVEISKALRRFKQDVGYFPDEANLIDDYKKLALLQFCQSTDSTQITTPTVSYDENCKAWDINTGRGWRGPYLSSDGYQKNSDEDNSYQDGWGSDYANFGTGTEDIRIVSIGIDKTYGGDNLGSPNDICRPNTTADGKDDLVLCLLK